MLLRLLIGLIKGIIIGGLVGYGLAAAGLTAGWLMYVAAAVTGLLVALFAGKPIWAQDARIEVGMKAAAGAIFTPLLLLLVRSFVNLGLPFDPTSLPGLASLPPEALTLGSFSVTALAMAAGVLAAFYDADNSPTAAKPSAGDKKAAPASQKRLEEAPADVTLESETEEEQEAAQQKRRS